jgi:predicted phage-related endonuclease
VTNNREIILPESRDAWLAMRALDVTSTESAMLFGLSPYGTEFELWHRKRSKAVVDIDSNERMGWGLDLQDAIAGALCRRYGVIAEPIKHYVRIPESRMGSSFDWRIVGVDENVVAADTTLQDLFTQHGKGLLEIKNVDGLVFKQQWMRIDEDGGGQKYIEPPGHIDVQVQHQLHVCGHKWAGIGVLVGGNKSQLLTRIYDPQVGHSLESRIVRLWSSIEAGVPPKPIYPADAEFVAKLYGVTGSSVHDGRGDEVLTKALGEYCSASAREKLAKEDKDVAKAKVLEIVKDASKVVADGYTVSLWDVAETPISYVRKGFRSWRVTQKKGS